MLDKRRHHLLRLMLYKSYANLKTELSKLHLGILWWVIEPVLHMTIYYVVFAVLQNRGSHNFIPFLLIGLVSWRWFQGTVMQAATSIIANKALMQQVYVTKTLFPAITLISNTVKFTVTFFILLVFLWLYGLTPNRAYIALPLVLGTQFLWIAGCGYLCAAILPFMPDLRILMDNFLRALMFLSGIFYSGERIAPEWQFYFFLNPIASLIQSYRDILISGELPGGPHLAVISLVSIFMILLGKHLLTRFDYLYPRVVM